VLEQQAAQVGAAGIMGSDHTYVIPGAEEPRRAGAAARKRCAPFWTVCGMPSARSHGLAFLGSQAHNTVTFRHAANAPNHDRCLASR